MSLAWVRPQPMSCDQAMSFHPLNPIGNRRFISLIDTCFDTHSCVQPISPLPKLITCSETIKTLTSLKHEHYVAKLPTAIFGRQNFGYIVVGFCRKSQSKNNNFHIDLIQTKRNIFNSMLSYISNKTVSCPFTHWDRMRSIYIRILLFVLFILILTKSGGINENEMTLFRFKLNTKSVKQSEL